MSTDRGFGWAWVSFCGVFAAHVATCFCGVNRFDAGIEKRQTRDQLNERSGIYSRDYKFDFFIRDGSQIENYFVVLDACNDGDL